MVVFYTLDSLRNPKEILYLEKSKFEDGGRQGLISRNEYAMNNAHIDQRIDQILERVTNFLKCNVNIRI